MGTLICHPADKALGPFVVTRPKYFKQFYDEHLSNKYNYVRLNTNEATNALPE